MRWRKVSLDADGVRLSVRDSGGAGRPVLLIHGLGLSQRSWGPVSHRLANRFRVVTYDQRGHGASARAPDYSLSAFLRDVEVVVAELSLEQAVLAGHSFGGHLAVAYAAQHRGCAGVIGVEGGVPVNLPAADWALIEAGGRKAFTRVAMAALRLIRLGAAVPYDEMKRLVEESGPWLRGLGAAYDRIACPVLLILGSEPDRVPQGPEIREAVRQGALELQEAHPEVAVRWLPCGHLVPLERPTELSTTIERFAASLP